MEIQKFRILRTNPDVNWTIPCSGATDLWPLNTSTNCTGTTIYDTTFSEIMEFINSNSVFPEKLKDCSATNPGVIVDDTSYTTDPNYCSNIGGHKYLLFNGLSLVYNSTNISGSYNELDSVIEGFHTGTFTSLIPNVAACTCISPLGTYLNKLPIYMSQDYNDIGHYDIWDGNIGQQDTFGNFILSATSSTGYQITAYRTTDIAYHAGVKTSIFTIDWGDGNVTDYGAASYQETHTYGIQPQKQYKITITQDTPWGSKSVSNIITIPHATYPVMFNQPYSPPTSTGPGSGITSNQVSLTGLGTSLNPGGGASSAYYGIYGTIGDRSYMPLDSATDIDQFSAMTYGVNSADGAPCYTVSGITDSMLGNFQTYTTASTANLPPGYQAGVLVPIGGDVLNPLTNTFETGVFGSILYATPTVTAYTISSAYGASGGNANGDTPIFLWDFDNGITIFEAESCGLDKMAFGALECIDCPNDDCMWCQYKDEYIDRTNNTAYEIPTTNVMGLWDSTVQYSFGDIVYDITWNACCCYVNVGGNPATVVGISPSGMMEGVFNGIHMWEACSDECVSCPIGTQSPCNDTSIAHAYPDATSIPAGKASYYNPGNNYSPGDYAKGGNGNCYKALNSGTLAQPTGSTVDWDYVGCVAWDCPTDQNASDCVMISGVTNSSTMSYGDCKSNFDDDFCFEGQWICDSYFQCGGCHEIFPGDVSGLYNSASAYTSNLDCLATCSPPAWSCSTPTAINCCVSFNCVNGVTNYIDNVWQAYDQFGADPMVLSGQGLFFDQNDCTSDCCIYSSFTWNCEQGCISQNNTGGYATFGECLAASNTDTNLNPHIGEINPATGSLYVSNGTGIYDAILNNIPCGWSCGTITEIYNPMPDDPQGTGIYLSPCEPCFENGCGVETMEEDCVNTCSAVTNCYICNCLDFNSCMLVAECPTYTDLTETSYGPNNGTDTGLYLTLTAGTYSTFDVGEGPLFTYSSASGCSHACACAGFDCPVYRSDHNFYDPNNPQASVGQGCGAWTELELHDNKYTWSAGNPDGTAYTSHYECCVANPGCCNAVCVDCYRYPNACDNTGQQSATYPCQYFDDNLTPYPAPLYFSTTMFSYPMVACQASVLTLPNGDIVCEMPQTCDCACSAMTTSWINSYHFPGTTGLTLNHTGDWDEVLYDGNGDPINHSYESGDTVTHEQPIAYSNECCYICVCVEGTGSLVYGLPADCNDFEPGTGANPSGQPNCWVDCQSDTAFPGGTCQACTPSPNNTYECDPGGAGCVSSTCNYNAPGISTAWATANNCYLASDCNGECYHGCGCNSVSTLPECVMLQDVLNGIQNPDISPIPTSFPSPTAIQCQTLLSAGQDCCSPIGVSYDCIADTGCTSDPTSVISGPGQGCVEIYPPAIGMFNDTNLTQSVPGVGSVTFATPLDACKAFCTWSCENNNGCDFDPWHNYPAPTNNTAYDCWFNSGQDCNNCNESYFCYSGTTWGLGNNIISASELAALGAANTGIIEHEQALGQAGLTYNQNQQGFPDEASCQVFCRFKCNSDPLSCACELAWGDTFGGETDMQECQNQQEPCCYAEWWCMPVEGCKGYMTNQLVVDGGPGAPAGHAGGPYYQIGQSPATAPVWAIDSGKAGCLDYCGYVCGDGFELYLGECGCSWVHNEPDTSLNPNYNDSPPTSAGIIIGGQAGVYDTNAQCILAGVGVTIGNLGCCDCYDCVQQTMNQGGTPWDFSSLSVNGLDLNWTVGGQSTTSVDAVQFDGSTAQAWDGTGGIVYNQGDIVVYVSGASNCCYVYNGCCDSNVNTCNDSSLVCQAAGGTFTNPYNHIDPHTTWTEYQAMMALGTGTDCAGFSGNLVINNPLYRGLQQVGFPNPYGSMGACGGTILTTDIWTQGPDWIPCDQSCPA